MRSFFCDDNLNLKVRQRMVKSYVWPILLYGVEAWTLKVTPMNRLEAFEMWVFRRMLRIPWAERVTNRDVLKRSNTQRELLNTVKCRKISYLGHILRGSKYRLLQLILKGKIEGRRGPGRKQQSWLRNILGSGSDAKRGKTVPRCRKQGCLCHRLGDQIRHLKKKKKKKKYNIYIYI